MTCERILSDILACRSKLKRSKIKYKQKRTAFYGCLKINASELKDFSISIVEAVEVKRIEWNFAH